MTTSSLAVMERHLIAYRRLWKSSALSAVLTPVLFMVSIGVGVGGFVDEVDGVPYLAWIAAPLLLSAVFQQTAQESTSRVFHELNTTRTVHAIVATSAGVRDVLVGRLLYLMIRVQFSTVCFLAIAACFGAVRSWWILAEPLVAAAVAIATALPLTALASTITDDTYLPAVSRLITVPVVLFSGILFPPTKLPEWAAAAVYASPLWHGVDLARAAALGQRPDWPLWAHIAVLGVWSAAGYALSSRILHRRVYDGNS
ncbi:transport permease protein [Streptomyces albospinus]|uniref:Transport permease protein n=1 Tax=Streptomyces albospinus TaxID=285515 RepID=A0ABQ2VNG8_9ACTN|nr:ABC transporter permease [Streptomyces albospinus]GGV02222.1 transport permease protein [Streptomyces albospinus]